MAGESNGPGLGSLQRLMESALPAANAAQMLSEYAATPSAAGSWDAFVAHNWLPVLSLALGSQWRTKYDGEVAAMIALQASLEPAAAVAGGGAAGASPPPTPTAALAGPPPARKAAPEAPQVAKSRVAGGDGPTAVAAEAAAARAFTLEAVDVDGKRRRLRRKRAASPDSPHFTAAESRPAVGSDSAEAAPAADPPAPPPLSPPPPQRALGSVGGVGAAAAGRDDGSAEAACLGSLGQGEAALPDAGAAAKPSLMQRVIRQVTKLSISTPPSASTADGAGPPASPSGAATPAAACSSGGATAGKQAAGGVGRELQRGLLDSLSLVHDLSQRIVDGLQREVESHGLAVPPQVSAAPGGGPGLPLSMLLGGNLVDRMDLLGRTALHVASAAGRADTVGQLLAAGASANKALPMDYRTLLKQHPDMQQPGTQHGCAGDGRCACGAVGRAPPPKRGRYLTAGPPELGPPSLQYCTALHLAALHGHLEVVAALLASGQCAVNARNIDGATPLHLAAHAGHERAVALLCRAPGVQLDAPDLQGRTPLHTAASQGHAAVVVELWARGALIDPCDLHSWTALHYACRAGHTEVAAKLVIAGAAVAACDQQAVTPAHLAAERGFTDIVGKLLMAGYVADSVTGALAEGSERGTALHLAAAQGREGVVTALLQAGADPRVLDFSARNALDLAVLHGHIRLVPPLLDAGCWFTNGSALEECLPQPAPGDPAARQLQLLRCLAADAPMQHEAWAGLGCGEELVAESFRLSFAESGLLEVLQALVARGLQLGGRAGCDLLAAAVQSGGAPLVAWLLGPGRCDVAAALQQEDLVHEAASRGDVEALGSLLQAASPACLARADGRGLGRTPLHSAVIHGRAAAAELLVAAQLDADAVQAVAGKAEATATPAAGAAAEEDDAKQAAARGLDAADSQGFTALHWAAVTGNTSTLRRLLAAGASANAATAEGQTPLHLACKAGHVGAVHALLEAGAAVAAADTHGCLPLHYCALRGDLALFVLLFSPSAPSLGPSAGAGAALLTAAIRGGSSEMVGIVLMTGAATPQKCMEAGQMPVHAAAREGSLEVLQYLYGSGFDMTALDAEQKSPLHHAPIGRGQTAATARRDADHRQVAEVLLASGCRVDARDAHGCTPLHFAAGAGALGMLCRFLELSPRGAAGVDLPDSIGWTPLFWACNNGHAAAAEWLLAEGGSPWSRDCNQRMPLHFAAEAGHVACVRLLASHMRGGQEAGGPDAPPGAPPPDLLQLPDQNGQTPVQLAAEAGHPDCVAALLDADGTAESKRRTALHLASQQGRLEIARLVLAVRRLAVSSKDADGWLPIHFAAAAGHAEIVQALLAAGSDAEEPAVDGDSPLHKAAIGGHLPVVRLLKTRTQLDARNSTGSTPLYNAASQGHVTVMQELVDEGASVDAATTNGCSPLYIAANNGFAEAAGLLLELGADPDLETTSGCTPLHAAALNGHAPVAERLVAAGCDVDLQSQNGSSALHNAASGGHVAVVDCLLAARADCDVQNSNGNTPLHLAAGKGWVDVAERLAAAGADTCIRNSKGWLAIQSASNSGCFEAVLRLVQHGSPWRLKGEADVVKLLAKKSSYKPSYVEGRLRLAEKERQRRLAREAAAAAGPAGGGEPDLSRAAAQADAAMAELLQEEEADQERAARQRAKRAAKKQKAAAKRQEAEQKAAEEEAEEERRRQEEAAAAAAQPGGGNSGGEAALRHARLEECAQLLAGLVEEEEEEAGGAAASAVEPPRRPKHGGPRGRAGTKAAAPPAGAARLPGSSAVPASPARAVLAVGVRSPPPGAGKQGRGNGSHAASPAPRAAPHVVAAPRSQASTPAKQAPAAQPAQQPARAAAPAATASAGPYVAAAAGQSHASRPAPATAAGAPVTRPAPWAGMAAARTSAPEQDGPLDRQAAAAASGRLPQAPIVTRPAHIASTLSPAPGSQPLHYPSAISAAAASLGLAPRLAPPWTAPPAPPPLCPAPGAPSGALAALHGAPGDTSSGLPASSAQQGTLGQPHQQHPLQAAPALVDSGGSALLQPAAGLAAKLRQQQLMQAGGAPAPAPGFVPLFGLNLPTFQGLGVDWSVQGSAAAATFGSPARAATSSPFATPPAPAPPPLPLAPAAAPSPAGAAAAFLGGSFSPSDASSIESSEADDLLHGMYGHISRAHLGGAAAPARASPPVPGKAGAAPLPAGTADADGIDDVLRLQPWLE